jgi:hypothetical protein
MYILICYGKTEAKKNASKQWQMQVMLGVCHFPVYGPIRVINEAEEQS